MAKNQELVSEYKVYTSILNKLVTSLKLKAAVLSDSQGLPIASSMLEDLEESTVSGLSAYAMGLGEKVCAEIQPEKIEQVTIKSESNIIIVNRIAEDAILTVVADVSVNFGKLLVELRSAVSELQGGKK